MQLDDRSDTTIDEQSTISPVDTAASRPWLALHRQMELRPTLASNLSEFDLFSGLGTESFQDVFASYAELLAELRSLDSLSEGAFDWSEEALDRIDEVTTGADKTYAKLALAAVKCCLRSEPRVYGAPAGGVVIEHREGGNILSVVIEGKLGLIIRSADDFLVRAEFEINATSINEMIARYKDELRLLAEPPGVGLAVGTSRKR